MPYDYQTGDEWQDGERVAPCRPREPRYVIDPQTGQNVFVGKAVPENDENQKGCVARQR